MALRLHAGPLEEVVHGEDVGVEVGLARLPGRATIAGIVVDGNVDLQLLGELQEEEVHLPDVHRVAVRPQQRRLGARPREVEEHDRLLALGHELVDVCLDLAGRHLLQRSLHLLVGELQLAGAIRHLGDCVRRRRRRKEGQTGRQLGH